MPEEVDPHVGQTLIFRLSDGKDLPVLVERVDEETVTLDANHPLAGESLVFEVELLEIESPRTDLEADWLDRFDA